MRIFDDIYISVSFLSPILCSFIFCIFTFIQTPYENFSTHFPSFDDSRYFFRESEPKSQIVKTYNMDEMLLSQSNLFRKDKPVPLEKIDRRDLAFCLIQLVKDNENRVLDKIVCFNIENPPDMESLIEIGQAALIFSASNKKFKSISRIGQIVLRDISGLLILRLFRRRNLFFEMIFIFYSSNRIRVRHYQNFMIIYVFSDLLPHFVLRVPPDSLQELESLIKTNRPCVDQISLVMKLFVIGMQNTTHPPDCPICFNTFTLCLFYNLLDSYTIVHCFDKLVISHGQNIIVCKDMPCRWPKALQTYDNSLVISSLEYNFIEKYIFNPPNDANMEKITLNFFADHIEGRKCVDNLHMDHDLTRNNYSDHLMLILERFDSDMMDLRPRLLRLGMLGI